MRPLAATHRIQGRVSGTADQSPVRDQPLTVTANCRAVWVRGALQFESQSPSQLIRKAGPSTTHPDLLTLPRRSAGHAEPSHL